MFSLRRLVVSAARPAALSPATFAASRYARPQNLAELKSFEALLQRRMYNEEGGERRGPPRDRDGLVSRVGGGNGYNPRARTPRHELPPLAPSKVVYVGNLRYECTEEDLIDRFKQYGEVVASKIVRHPDDGRSRGWGYVEFKSLDDSASAIENMNNAPFMGRRLSVQFVQRTNLRLAGNEPSNVLFLGNLPFQLTDDDLNELFKNIRGCVDVRVAMDRRTGQPRGFAHADFRDVESAVKAKTQLEGTQVYGRYIRVDYSEHVNRGTATDKPKAEGEVAAATEASEAETPAPAAESEAAVEEVVSTEPSAIGAAAADEAEAKQPLESGEEAPAGKENTQ
ncbi:hypothetical protein EX30DRAFT_68019 [Ascodesmis nigricans]|uniref:RRM domain-containing protein n=1 Tax=Ascodesmis nigricans TaxID=341454 RepID=A0A4S2MU78_9PEZI|nr:hypothetical protein EX30DRAFT_68019 [Ascodesmis nigricans]